MRISSHSPQVTQCHSKVNKTPTLKATLALAAHYNQTAQTHEDQSQFQTAKNNQKILNKNRPISKSQLRQQQNTIVNNKADIQDLQHTVRPSKVLKSTIIDRLESQRSEQSTRFTRLLTPQSAASNKPEQIADLQHILTQTDSCMGEWHQNARRAQTASPALRQHVLELRNLQRLRTLAEECLERIVSPKFNLNCLTEVPTVQQHFPSAPSTPKIISNILKRKRRKKRSRTVTLRFVPSTQNYFVQKTHQSEAQRHLQQCIINQRSNQQPTQFVQREINKSHNSKNSLVKNLNLSAKVNHPSDCDQRFFRSKGSIAQEQQIAFNVTASARAPLANVTPHNSQRSNFNHITFYPDTEAAMSARKQSRRGSIFSRAPPRELDASQLENYQNHLQNLSTQFQANQNISDNLSIQGDEFSSTQKQQSTRSISNSNATPQKKTAKNKTYMARNVFKLSDKLEDLV